MLLMGLIGTQHSGSIDGGSPESVFGGVNPIDGGNA